MDALTEAATFNYEDGESLANADVSIVAHRSSDRSPSTVKLEPVDPLVSEEKQNKKQKTKTSEPNGSVRPRSLYEAPGETVSDFISRVYNIDSWLANGDPVVSVAAKTVEIGAETRKDFPKKYYYKSGGDKYYLFGPDNPVMPKVSGDLSGLDVDGKRNAHRSQAVRRILANVVDLDRVAADRHKQAALGRDRNYNLLHDATGYDDVWENPSDHSKCTPTPQGVCVLPECPARRYLIETQVSQVSRRALIVRARAAGYPIANTSKKLIANHFVSMIDISKSATLMKQIFKIIFFLVFVLGSSGVDALSIMRQFGDAGQNYVVEVVTVESFLDCVAMRVLGRACDTLHTSYVNFMAVTLSIMFMITLSILLVIAGFKFGVRTYRRCRLRPRIIDRDPKIGEYDIVGWTKEYLILSDGKAEMRVPLTKSFKESHQAGSVMLPVKDNCIVNSVMELYRYDPSDLETLIPNGVCFSVEVRIRGTRHHCLAFTMHQVELTGIDGHAVVRHFAGKRHVLYLGTLQHSRSYNAGSNLCRETWFDGDVVRAAHFSIDMKDDAVIVELSDKDWIKLGQPKKLSTSNSVSGASVAVFKPTPKGVFWSAAGSIKNKKENLHPGTIQHTATTEPGWSGSPLISNNMVVGIHHTGNGDLTVPNEGIEFQHLEKNLVCNILHGQKYVESEDWYYEQFQKAWARGHKGGDEDAWIKRDAFGEYHFMYVDETGRMHSGDLSDDLADEHLSERQRLREQFEGDDPLEEVTGEQVARSFAQRFKDYKSGKKAESQLRTRLGAPVGKSRMEGSPSAVKETVDVLVEEVSSPRPKAEERKENRSQNKPPQSSLPTMEVTATGVISQRSATELDPSSASAPLNQSCAVEQPTTVTNEWQASFQRITDLLTSVLESNLTVSKTVRSILTEDPGLAQKRSDLSSASSSQSTPVPVIPSIPSGVPSKKSRKRSKTNSASKAAPVTVRPPALSPKLVSSTATTS